MYVSQAQKDQVTEWIRGLNERVRWMQALAERTDVWEHDLTWRLAAERALHTSVEYLTDIASLIIDALVMRDAGGYADILKVLVEENVLSASWFQEYEGIFPLRARFIRDHAGIQPSEVRDAISTFTPLYPSFVDSIERYLQL